MVNSINQSLSQALLTESKKSILSQRREGEQQSFASVLDLVTVKSDGSGMQSSSTDLPLLLSLQEVKYEKTSNPKAPSFTNSNQRAEQDDSIWKLV